MKAHENLQPSKTLDHEGEQPVANSRATWCRSIESPKGGGKNELKEGSARADF